MPKEIDAIALRELLSSDRVQLIEVLPADEFREEHIPGAINIPLKTLTRSAVSDLDPARTTVLYCWDDA